MRTSSFAFRNCQVAAPLKPQGAPDANAQAKTFRNCQVAAPLKLEQARHCPHPGPAFRNCQVAAPLKLGAAALVARAVHDLPQLSSCGPIEARLTIIMGRP